MGFSKASIQQGSECNEAEELSPAITRKKRNGLSKRSYINLLHRGEERRRSVMVEMQYPLIISLFVLLYSENE